MTGPGAVTALVLLESTVGLVAGAAWAQSWSVVRRGHFRIVAWVTVMLGLLAAAAALSAVPRGTIAAALFVVTAGGAGLYLLAQYARSDVPGALVGGATAAIGIAALAATAGWIPGWPTLLAAAELVSGAVLVGAVLNGMLLGHWYLNQPGLKPWALARLTTLALVASGAKAALGVIGAGRLSAATTPGAALGLPGFGESFGTVFYAVWLGLALFTGAVVFMARRCIAIRSIQSATGLYYVALLTAIVSEFLVRYLMVNA